MQLQVIAGGFSSTIVRRSGELCTWITLLTTGKVSRPATSRLETFTLGLDAACAGTPKRRPWADRRAGAVRSRLRNVFRAPPLQLVKRILKGKGSGGFTVDDEIRPKVNHS